MEVRVNKELKTVNQVCTEMDRVDKLITSFKRLTGKESPEDNMVYSFNNGSLIIGISATAGAALAILKCVKMLYEIKIQHEKVKQEMEKTVMLKFLSEDLQKKVTEELSSNTINYDKVTETLLAESHNSKNSENVNEIRSLIKKSVKEIYELIEKGGEIDLLEESKSELLSEDSTIEEKELISETLKSIDYTQQHLLSGDKEQEALLLKNENTEE